MFLTLETQWSDHTRRPVRNNRKSSPAGTLVTTKKWMDAFSACIINANHSALVTGTHETASVTSIIEQSTYLSKHQRLLFASDRRQMAWNMRTFGRLRDTS